jgi:hypothetical protein
LLLALWKARAVGVRRLVILTDSSPAILGKLTRQRSQT